MCRYLIEGLNNADDLEGVVVRFDMFHMPQVLGASRGDCSEGGLTLFLEGRDDKGAEQRTLCGTHVPTDAIVSRDSKMLLKFYSGKTQGLGFTIRYQFETFFAVPGTPHPITTTCEFTYRSTTTKSGEFHSPRHPSNYPSNKNCTYIFQGDETEQAHVEFDHFKLDGLGSYGPTCDNQDYIDLYELLEPGSEQRGYREIGRYCGLLGPAPLKSRYGVHALQMNFITNAAAVTIRFRGRYYFDPQQTPFHPDRTCGNVTNGTHGTIESPNFDGNAAKYPANTDCEWYIRVRPSYNILINFTFFELEGEQRGSPTGCLGAGLKIYTDLHKYPAELCGKLNGTSYHSHGPTMKLLFTSAKRASGNRGFRLTWNEFHYPPSGLGSGCEGDEFYCPVHSYCISNQRVCDGEYHRGEKDLSDEDPVMCGTVSGEVLGLSHGTFGGIVGGGAGVLLIVIVVVVCVVRRRSAATRRKRQMQPPIQPGTSLPSTIHSPRPFPFLALLDLLTPPSASPLTSLPSSWLLLLFYSVCLCLGTCIVLAFDCDFIRVSNEDGVKNGSFTAPLINGHPIPPQGIQCIYTFIALPHERVKLTFREFHLTGRPPDCLHEYVDLYTELRNASEDLVQTDKFGGRFCGRIPPRTRVSLHNTIVLVFASDRNVTAHSFTGMYEFINASMYNMGTKTHSQGTCDFVIKSWVNRLGDLFTPTYPGVYPQRIMCTYQLLGQRGQRVRVEFMDFDLFFGGAHCPYDRLTIYDGSTEQDPIIDAYCGSRRNVVVFSSQENLFISFITNRSGGENRGFHALFEFSETYVSLDFITGEHLRGTECDQRVLSHGRSSGVVRSPNSPFPFLPNVMCRYLIEGLNNADDLERVVVRFDMFHMPQVLGDSRGDCSEGGLTLFLEGREDKGAEQRTLCGTHVPTDAIVSRDSKMLLKFYSGKTQGLGFTIRYQFETFFAVPGTPHPITTTCEFTYRSTSTKSGEFHSPRHPSNYPSNKNCTYIFQGDETEQAHVEFDNFKLDGLGSYGPTCDNQDYIDLYELLEPGGGNRGYREIGRYCGLLGPAPAKSRYGVHALQMNFITNAAAVTIGFRGRYYFDPQQTPFHPDRICGNVTNGTHGAIESPNFDGNAAKYPPNIDCEWYIHVRPSYNILINFTFFELEGEQRTQSPTGCLGAGLKIYTDLHKYPAEVCGKLNDTSYHSHGPTMKLLFTSAKRASGNRGFRLTWNEFHYPHSGLGSGCEGDEFYCPVHSYCISNQRVCDGEYHCGEKDLSDEDPVMCGTVSGEVLGLSHGTFWGIVGGGLGMMLIVIVVVVCVGRRRSAAKRSKCQMQPPVNDWSS